MFEWVFKKTSPKKKANVILYNIKSKTPSALPASIGSEDLVNADIDTVNSRDHFESEIIASVTYQMDPTEEATQREIYGPSEQAKGTSQGNETVL